MGMAKDPGAGAGTHEAREAHEAHEAMCRRCGMSCHFAVPVNGLAVVIDALRCKFLGRSDDGRFHCTVYERRFELAPWCHTAEGALAAGFLAQDCPYARGVPGYRGKARLSPSLLRQVLPALRAEVARAGAPIGADPDAALAFVAEAGGQWRYAISEDGTRYVFERQDNADVDAEEPPPSPREATKLRVIS